MKVNLKENIVINNQLLPNNITNGSVLKLFRLIDKVSFFDEVDKSMANVDDNFFFNEKRFMLKNSIIGKLLNLIIDNNYSNALNVGSSTGFTSAILSQISSFVISLESDKSLHEKEKKNLKIHKCKIFSQSDEDGLIMEILSNIGVKSFTFIEIGVQDSIECNSTNLVLNLNWKGAQFEGCKESYEDGKKFFRWK